MKNRFPVRQNIARLYEGFPIQRILNCTRDYNDEVLEKVYERLKLRRDYNGRLSLIEMEADIEEIVTGLTEKSNLREVLEIFRKLDRRV